MSLLFNLVLTYFRFWAHSWAKGNPRLFTSVCRAALESDYITNALPEWIDLTFGYKQTGRRAKEALNLYHPYVSVHVCRCELRLVLR